ncbi:MAG: AAA family ATPase [Pseudomonadales bacterium]
MYEEHFHLRKAPFSIAPDPSFLYLSSSHREAMAHLRYGLSNGGFVLITGEVGTGKTTLLRNLLQETPPDLDVAFILNPRLTVRELLESLCDELGISYDRSATGTVKQYIDVLNRHLLKTHQAGRSTVVIIDEAQNLSPAVLEQVRLLTNLETDERKLLRIILLGQPELADLLGRQELRQLAQRITARYHLGTLNREDCRGYVMHRLSHVGGDRETFTNAAHRRLFRLSGGVPRLINTIADRALLGAYAEDRARVTARIVSRASAEVLGRKTDWRPWLYAGLGGVVLVAAAWALQVNRVPVENGATAGIPPSPDAAQSSAAALPAAPFAAAPSPVTPSSAASTPTPDDPAAGSTSAEAQQPAGSTVPAGTDVITAFDTRSEPAGVAVDAQVQVSDAPQAGVPEASASPASLPRPVAEILRPAGNTFQLRRQAYAAVFNAWGVEFDIAAEGQIPCDFAPSAGLLCLSERGDWTEIERLDLPVILELWDEQEAPYHAALTALRDAQLTLHLDGKDIHTTQRALRDHWFGSYVVLWRTPPGYSGSLRIGDAHETVTWLRRQLAELNPALGIQGTSPVFDAELQSAILEFQKQEGLVEDGIVGPATWIRIAHRLRLPAPSLAG